MRVLWVLWSRALDSTSHLSGSERIERSSYLSKEGFHTFLLAGDFPKNRYKNEKNLRFVSIPLKFIPTITPLLYGLALFFFLPFYIVKIRPDFIMTDVSPTPFMIWKPFLSKLLNFKIILDIRSTPVGMSRRSFGTTIFNLSVWIAKTMFDGVTIVTPMMKKGICEAFGLNSDRVGVLPNGISDDFINYREKKCELIDLREKLGLSNRFVVIYHGSFRDNGGIFESIEAIKLIKDDYPDIVLFLLGTTSPQILEAMKRTIQTNSLNSNVIIHGPVDFHKVPDFIAMSDVGLVPLPNISAWRYQQPLKLLEYMSMGKPIIAVDSPAQRDVAGESRGVVYIRDSTPNELAKAMIFAYNNIDELKNWHKQGQQIIKEKFVWTEVNNELIKYLMRI
jgi:glycosyltransferase involved in cell wall biosynthesis